MIFDDFELFVCVQESIPIEEVFENLRCSKDGLTSSGALERLSIFGHNKLEEKKVFMFFWDHLSVFTFVELQNLVVLMITMSRFIVVMFLWVIV